MHHSVLPWIIHASGLHQRNCGSAGRSGYQRLKISLLFQKDVFLVRLGYFDLRGPPQFYKIENPIRIHFVDTTFGSFESFIFGKRQRKNCLNGFFKIIGTSQDPIHHRIDKCNLICCARQLFPITTVFILT